MRVLIQFSTKWYHYKASAPGKHLKKQAKEVYITNEPYDTYVVLKSQSLIANTYVDPTTITEILLKAVGLPPDTLIDVI